MQTVAGVQEHAPEEAASELRLPYLWLMAAIAALGGLLFGYDWVVIGGAREFFESYFHLHSAALVGWANSCALVGCFAGSLISGRLSDGLGRKRLLMLAALLFAVSSLLTGWAHNFDSFIVWRIVGGVAIGLASTVSPMYIAEISPAACRGRLVSLNQLALVVGILAAQVANWLIARPGTSGAIWNVQYGWRWMFTAVAVPAMVLLVSAPFLPESPRWLMAQGREEQAERVLTRIGGAAYSDYERRAIRRTVWGGQTDAQRDKGQGGRDMGRWRDLASPSLRRLVLIGIGLVVLQQASGITVLFNYAEEIYRSSGSRGSGTSTVLLDIVITGVINLIFTVVAMGLVDRIGRRQIMLFGCISVGVSQLGASLAYHERWSGGAVLVLTLCAIGCYAMSLAPVTWVLLSEIFPNRARAESMSVSIAVLWLVSFTLTLTFPMLSHSFGTPSAFLLYGIICLAGAVFVWIAVPETKGRPLEAACGP